MLARTRGLTLQRLPRQAWAALIPIAVAVAVLKLSEKRLLEVLGLGLGLALLAFFIPRPGPALVVLIVFLPIQPLGFGLLLHIHVPASILKDSSAFKELLGISVLIAGLARFRGGRERLDRIDKALLAYIAVVTLYLALPHLFSTTAPHVWKARILAWRSDCGYVLLAFAARHAPISAAWKRRFFNTVLIMGAVTVVGAMYQRVATSSWNNFVLNTARQPEYLQKVIGSFNPQTDLRYIYNPKPLHVGSIFLSPYDMSDYLVLVGAVAIERITSKKARPAIFVLIAGVLAAIFFSRVRADALALVIVLGLALLPEVRRPVEGRIRLLLAIAIGAAILVPALAGTRFVGGENAHKSSTGHVQEIQRGITYLVHNPLGLGLGYQPATIGDVTGQTGPTNLTTDNSVTQVGDELGFEALVPWVLFIVLGLYELRRRGRLRQPHAVGAGLGLLGVLIAGQYHHVFLLYPVPWTLWAAVGLALSNQPPQYEADPPDPYASHAETASPPELSLR